MTENLCHPDKIRFWQMLAEGCCSGQQLLATLRSIQSALPPEPVGDAVAALADDVEAGLTLSEAMKKQPAIFTKAHVCLVEGGEYLGIIDRVLLLILEQSWRCPACGNL